MKNKYNFRGWDNKEKKWRYFSLDDMGKGYMEIFLSEITEVCMLTEIKDLDNRDVYTDDIVIAEMENEIGSFEEVKAIIIFTKGMFTLDLLTGGNLGFGGTYRVKKVIGNTIENPELLSTNESTPQ